jgi:hypothetical protein
MHADAHRDALQLDAAAARATLARNLCVRAGAGAALARGEAVSVMVLQVFVSLMLVVGSIVLFVWTVRSRTLDHADRLSLAPLEDDPPQQPTKDPE